VPHLRRRRRRLGGRSACPLGLIHGDYRLDNLLFTEDSCTIVDWQTVSWGPELRDAAYFVGTGLSDADRRHHERDLVRFYYDELVRGGVDDFSWQQCWDEYRRQTFASLRVTIFAGVVVERTDRGDDMLMALLAPTPVIPCRPNQRKPLFGWDLCPHFRPGHPARTPALRGPARPSNSHDTGPRHTSGPMARRSRQSHLSPRQPTRPH
jgi:hypothetical protein